MEALAEAGVVHDVEGAPSAGRLPREWRHEALSFQPHHLAHRARARRHGLDSLPVLSGEGFEAGAGCWSHWFLALRPLVALWLLVVAHAAHLTWQREASRTDALCAQGSHCRRV